MKKVFPAALCILLVLSLTACGGADSTPTPEQDPAPTATEPVSAETDAPDTVSPAPVLKIVDEDGTDLGTEITLSVGADNGKVIKFFTDHLGALSPRVGWDDSALTAAGITVVPSFDPEPSLYISAEAEATADLRVYLSATDDWSDADNPPLELIVTVIVTADAE